MLILRDLVMMAELRNVWQNVRFKTFENNRKI